MGMEAFLAAAARGTAPRAATKERRENPDPCMAGKISQHERYLNKHFQ
jgi:hypothetical protein